MSWGIYQHRFLDIMPVARDLLVETMETGVIVTDTENRIIDINRSASAMFDLGYDRSPLFGKVSRPPERGGCKKPTGNIPMK